ncbi:MAG TPA: hypothetical protein VEH84_06160 [Alphaproteobacteria bacterium]|nr:hypothetical protein [Alphaproteobacteria bacterium]
MRDDEPRRTGEPGTQRALRLWRRLRWAAFLLLPVFSIVFTILMLLPSIKAGGVTPLLLAFAVLFVCTLGSIAWIDRNDQD